MTSAYANKLLRQLEDEKAYWRNQEQSSYLYTAAINEEPVIPEYDYEEMSRTLCELDQKICRIKHAVNLANVTNAVMVGERSMTIDMILVRMAQLNRRRDVLNSMRKMLPKSRVGNMGFASRNAVPEYQYINYDLNKVKTDYDKINDEIMVMQIALDKYNQTVEFEVDID